MLTLFVIFMWACSTPGGFCSPHWRFKLEIGNNWDPAQKSELSYMTVADGKKFQQELIDVHQNTLLLRFQGHDNNTWDQVTLYIGMGVAALVLIAGVWQKMNGIRKFIPTGIHRQELTVLPSAPQMRHY